MLSFAIPSMAATASSSSAPLACCSSTSLHCSANYSNCRRRSSTIHCLRITASSSLADASALLRAAHHTVCYGFFHYFLENFHFQNIQRENKANVRILGCGLFIYLFFIGGYLHKKRHGNWFGVWSSFCHGYRVSGSAASCGCFQRFSGDSHVSFIYLSFIFLSIYKYFVFNFLVSLPPILFFVDIIFQSTSPISSVTCWFVSTQVCRKCK